MTTHIVCYSGGESSGLTALEVVRKFGRENVLLVNHDMHFTVEDPDIKRFKAELAAHLGLPITFVNYRDAAFDQFDVCVQKQAFKVQNGQEFCTSVLKTGPFMDFLAREFPAKDAVCYYGFDANEGVRIQRRSSIMAEQGYATDFPLAMWQRTCLSTIEIGIKPPLTYSMFKHANCIGCLKAGWQHWYCVYCTRPDIWLKAKWAEEEIGHAIHHDESGPVYLEDMEERFAIMKCAGVEPTEHMPHQKFWAIARKFIAIASTPDLLPCECTT
jgi:hypothetical protein